MPKHLVHVSAYYPPHLGGQEYAAQGLARELARIGHRVDVIASAHGAQPGKKVEDGLHITRLAGRAVGHAPIMPRFPGTLLKKTSRRSIVHIHIGQAFTPEMVWLVSKIRRFNYIAELHIDFEPSGTLSFLLPLYKKFVLTNVIRNAKAVVVLNESAQQAVRERYKYAGEIQRINNGIDEAYFTAARPAMAGTPPKTLHLLFVGRLTKQKNILALLEALRRSRHAVQLDIAGEGEEQPAIESYITRNRMPNVQLLGRVPHEQMPLLYAKYDALVMPSLYEAQPLVLLEAMAARIPIIGTDVTGVAEHLYNAGIVVEPTAAGLANGIDQFIVNYTSIPGLVANGYAKAEQHRWRIIVKQYETLYDKIATP